MHVVSLFFFYVQVTCRGQPGWDWVISKMKTSSSTLTELLRWAMKCDVISQTRESRNGVLYLCVKMLQYDWEAVFALSQDFLPWGPNQPDNWQNNEDCVHLRGIDHIEPGKLNDDFCTATREFICKKGLIHWISVHIYLGLCSYCICNCNSFFSIAKGQGPPPQPPTSGPGQPDALLIFEHELDILVCFLDMPRVCCRVEWEVRLLDVRPF